jgi:hypothetical protein
VKDDHPCHIAERHSGHFWWPAIPDPVEDRVVHIGLVELWCPGVQRKVE